MHAHLNTALFVTASIIPGANIVSEVKIGLSPGQPLTYIWEGAGFKVHIPAGAICAGASECDSVIMSIHASLSGEYELPHDCVLVSGVYWITLSPPVKLTEKVTISIQHSASVMDATLSFITAKFTNLPHKFEELPGGSFLDSDMGSIQVDHFSAFGISGSNKTYYALCTYYIPIAKRVNIWEAHITITPNLELALEVLHAHIYMYVYYITRYGSTLYVGIA